MNIIVKLEDMEDDYTLELFYSHSLILWDRKKEHVKAQSIFPTYKLRYFFATLEKNGGESVASDVEILIFCSEGSRV